MYFKRISFLFFLIGIQFATSQVKIGEQPDTIDPASIVELESTNKALVLTRLSNTQMQSISPLRGALIYNTDTQCIHYYDGTQWSNLCAASGGANQNLSFNTNTNILSLENGGSVDLSKFLSSSVTQAEIEALGFEVGPHTVDTNTQLTETDVDTFVANNGYITTEADGDATNEYNTGISFDGTYLIVTDGGGNQSIDISSLAYDDTAVQNNITDLQNDKEDTANKSTDVALGTSDVAFPTQNAVKTYVDNQVGTITTDDDISAVTFDGTNLSVTE
ncbi:hypothetical protein, partial [uncultured Maribacter sp.]|uniref:hypothetical protein n=1 Tax=uncultured Maribacter sp. TaxID=431308 RepID=UPI002606E2AD